MIIFVYAVAKSMQCADSLRRLLLFFEQLGTQIYLCQSNNIKGSFEKYVLTPSEKIQPDIIITFNKGGLRIAKKIYNNSNVPIIYSFCYSELNMEYSGRWGEWDHLFVIDENTTTNERIFPIELTTILRLNDQPNEFIPYRVNKSNLIFQVNFENICQRDSIFVKIAPVINSLPFIRFQLSGTKVNSSIYFNSNIKFSRNISTIAGDLVIGSGKIIEKAIALSIPCIVVGARGFGGLITRVNFEKQMESGFQGRIGGEIGEYIPENVLKDEILNFIYMEQDQVNKILHENHEHLCEYYQRRSNQLINVLSQTCKFKKAHNENLFSLKLKFSGLFSFIPKNSNQYLLRKTVTKQYHSTIEKAEFQIMHEFFEESYVKDVAQKYGYTCDMIEFQRFINELLNEKILKICE